MLYGAFGYLDPEYFQSSKCTEKSDVYSFGVVIIELLTGQKAISLTRLEEGRSLATYFIVCMEDNRFLDIVDSRIVEEGGEKEIMAMAKLAQRCLNLNGKHRPTMKEVALELEAIYKLTKTCSAQQTYEEIECLRTEAEPWDVSPSIVSNSYSENNSIPLLFSQKQ